MRLLLSASIKPQGIDTEETKDDRKDEVEYSFMYHDVSLRRSSLKKNPGSRSAMTLNMHLTGHIKN